MVSTSEWEKLTPYRQVRLRTEMYFGSRDPHTQQVLEYTGNNPSIVETTWIPAAFTAFREIVDNALDELVTYKNGTHIDITYDPENMIFSISDDGRGLPIEWSEQHKNYAATILLSEMNSGRNFKESHERGRGLNGVGGKGVTFCSEWLKVEVHRNKQCFEQRFQEGEELIVEEPIILPSNSKKSGTSIRFKLSDKVFPFMNLPESFIKARIYEIALCYPQLQISYNSQKIKIKNQTNGLFADKKPITFEINQEGFKGNFWLVPAFVESGDFSFSLVNAIPLFNGGTHLEAFRKGFYTGLLDALEKENKRRKLIPNRADVSEGLLIYNIIEMKNPSFDGQSKTRLVTESVGLIVRKALDDPEFFKNIIKKHPDWINDIYERCRVRTKGKDDKDAKKQGKKNLRQKIEDLEDACGYDRSKCTLFITEGKSAIAGWIDACNKEIHGGLPLRGKILNVYGMSNTEILANETLSKIMNSIGLIPGERINRHTLRYGKISITCDADQDGKNISCLLVNFFYQCWPDLFDPEKPPFIHVFNTPLIIAAKGKQRKYWYNEDYDDFNPEKYKGWDITRAKGLAALKKDDWKYILENPQTVPIIDDGQLKDSLTLLFSPANADLRKDFIGI